MDNLKITKIAAQMEQKQIPLNMLKNRTFDENHSVETIVKELESYYKEIQQHFEAGKSTDLNNMLETLTEWGKKGEKNE